MSYKPLTKQQAENMARPPLIEDGTYQFEVIEVHDTDKYHNSLKDRNGDPMSKIVLKIWDMAGRERLIFTNLYWGEQNKMSYRTRHFAESIDMIGSYESGEMLEKLNKCIGKLGYCDIYSQKPRPKEDGSGESWPAKNEVKDYIVKAQNNSASKQEIKEDEISFSDELPF